MRSIKCIRGSCRRGEGGICLSVFIVNELPVGLTGLLIASIFAAGMSTIATSVTSSSTIILTDYYQRFRKHAGNRERMLVLKLSSVGIYTDYYSIFYR